MKILVINAGSSSLKYQLINMEDESVLAVGLCERIGIDGGIVSYKNHEGKKIEDNIDFPNHKVALEKVIELMTKSEYAVISSLSEITAIGHRVVLGGEKVTKSSLLTDDVIGVLEECAELAPLHNPPQIMTIRVCQEIFGDKIKQVGVFDTSFHQTMPERAYIYPIPYEYYEKYGVRRYGYHGTSHRYVSARCASVMGKDIKDLKIVTCHLGNGCSITAVDGGKSIDTTMGLTPTAGFTMGTRCGDIDPCIAPYIMSKENIDIKEMDNIFNKKSGFLGISGVSSDARDLEEAYKNGNKRAGLALEIQQYQVRKYIGAYAAAMGGIDAIVFTGGIGENAIEHRADIMRGLEFLGAKLDENKNNTRGGEVEITTDDSTVKAFIISTNEELMIARDTANIVG